MSLKTSLNINALQHMQLTDHLQQAIKLLQLSALELNEFIQQEIEKNPLLIEEEDEHIDDLNNMANLRYDRLSNSGNLNSYNIEDSPIKKSLREHVLEQIYLDIDGDYDRRVALNIADFLTEAGYIEIDLSLLAKNINVPLQDVEKVLELMQKFDPSGIFARNLTECLKLQLQDLHKFHYHHQVVIENLALIAKGKIHSLLAQYHISEMQFMQIMKDIKSLNPKPGTIFSSNVTNYVVPDIYVRHEKEKLLVELNSGILPRLLVNKRYYAEVRKKTKNTLERKYLSEQLFTANWLIKALDKRTNTLLRVATEIVIRQHDFFYKGIKYLKPLTIKDIAQAVNLHESSVSRVTSNKFLLTPCGLFKMKFFFSSKIEAENYSEDFSSHSVKNLIQDIISKEEKPYSDQDIVLVLKNHNIHIARRTVAKYRESLRIPNAQVRKYSLVN